MMIVVGPGSVVVRGLIRLLEGRPRGRRRGQRGVFHRGCSSVSLVYSCM